MAQQIFDWLLSLPAFITSFLEWFQTPIYEPFINATPLELFSTAGVTIIITIIGMHVIRLFVG